MFPNKYTLFPEKYVSQIVHTISGKICFPNSTHNRFRLGCPFLTSQKKFQNEAKQSENKLKKFNPVLRSRIIIMQLRLRVKILMRLLLRLRLLPYSIAMQNF
jgi:hypothetical protein